MSQPERIEYGWNEQEWFEQQGYTGHDDDTDRHDQKYRDNGQGDEWGGAHSFVDGTGKEAAVAHRLLRDVAPLLCSTTLFRPPDRGVEPLFAWLFDGETLDHDPAATHSENREVELTEPELHVPRSVPDGFTGHDSGQYRHRRRLNRETGYVTGGFEQGGSTGVMIQDISAEDFLRIVDVFLATKHLPPKREREIRQFALSEKREGTDRDVDILQRVIWMTERAGGDN